MSALRTSTSGVDSIAELSTIPTLAAVKIAVDMVNEGVLTKEEALDNFEERVLPLLEAQAQAEAKRCMSCGQCFECDNCVVYCPQTAVFKVPKSKSTTGRYVDTDYDKCIGCHICKDVCPTGYIQMGLGE